jgi:hypothetical protein
MAHTNLPPGEQGIAHSSGFEIWFMTEEVELPLLFPGTEGVGMGVAELPSWAWPTGGLGTWQIQGAWALAPWGTGCVSSGCFGVAAPVVSSPLYSEYGFLVADYDTQSFLEVAGVLSLGGPTGETVSTRQGDFLDQATTVLLVAR